MSELFHVICSLPNASDSINGLAFKDHDKGRKITIEPLAADHPHVATFKAIDGYKVVPADNVPRRGRTAAAGQTGADDATTRTSGAGAGEDKE